jgi:hypothetical protein
VQLHKAIQLRAAAWQEQRHGTRANTKEEKDGSSVTGSSVTAAAIPSEQFGILYSIAGIEHRSIDVALHELDLTGFWTICHSA